MHFRDDVRAQVNTAEILTVAVVAARYFQNHHERALCVLRAQGDIRPISLSRFNRCLHAVSDLLWQLLVVLGEVFSQGKVFVIDTMPLPVCKKIRAKRCKKVQGDAFKGYCASKKEHYFGWQLHLLCDAHGVPVSFEILPAKWDELVPVQNLLAPLSEGSLVVADKGYISQIDELLAYVNGGVRLIPKYRKNIRGNSAKDAALIRQHRSMIETVNSQLEKMGIQRLHARTTPGFSLKVLASLIALSLTNAL